MESINLKRIYSFIIDSAILNFISVMIFSLLNLENNFYQNSIIILDTKIQFGFSFQIVVLIIYFLIFDLFNQGKSLGKLIFSIMVVDKSSLGKLSNKTLIKRTFLKVISIILFPISLIMFFIKDGFTIQEKYTDTKTIYSKS